MVQNHLKNENMRINNKVKGILCILMAMLLAFTYGLYFCATVTDRFVVAPYRWVLTGFFGVMWIVLAYKFLTKDND